MKNILFYVAACFFVVPWAAFAQENIVPADFIGPKPGYWYYYEGAGGLAMRKGGLTWDKEEALIVESTMVFPIKVKPESLCINELGEVYGIMADGARLLTKKWGADSGPVRLVEFDTQESSWGRMVTLPTKKKVMSKCIILSTYKKFLFGKERTVIEVGGDYCIPRTYASGIGLIRFNNDLQLVRIEKNGQPVSQY